MVVGQGNGLLGEVLEVGVGRSLIVVLRPRLEVQTGDWVLCQQRMSYHTVFSSQIWTKRSKPAPLTLETGDSEVAVAAVASIWEREGSIIDAVGLTAEDEAAKTASTARAKARRDRILEE